MEKERKVKYLSLAALVIAVLGLTIAFAAMSEMLTINGTATMDAATWDVHFENLSDVTLKGEARENKKPNISTDGLFVENINISLAKPKDEAIYTVDIVNKGSINAEITSIEKSPITDEQAKIFEFDVKYADGENIEESNILTKGEKKEVVIKLRFRDDIEASDLPKESQSINLSLKINYVQSDDKVLPPGGGDTSKTYEVGDEICLGSECFYVTKDNGDSVTALAKYNLLVGNIYDDKAKTNTPISSNTPGYGRQSSTAKGWEESSTTWTGVLPFWDYESGQICTGKDCGYWQDSKGNILPQYGPIYLENIVDIYDNNSDLYSYVKSYESYLKRNGYTSVSAKLMTVKDFADLGFDMGNGDSSKVPSWVYDTIYWLGSATDTGYNSIFITYPVIVMYGGVDSSENYGALRPVITISKSEI